MAPLARCPAVPLWLALLTATACGGRTSPTLPDQVAFEPEVPRAGEPFTCRWPKVDGKVLIRWQVDGEIVQDHHNPTWPADRPLRPGARVVCEVTVQGVAGTRDARAVVRPAEAPRPPNVLVLLADDLSASALRMYDEDARRMPTPHLNQLAREGVRFNRAYANPICSPTRATLLTGRYSRRTGIGTGATVGDARDHLKAGEITLPELVARAPTPYASAMVGKWHLDGDPAVARTAPLDQGFGWWGGSIGNLADALAEGGQQSYQRWQGVLDGEVRWIDTYATTWEVDQTLARIQAMPEPWLMYVAFHAPHAPWHTPPRALLPEDLRVDDADPKDRYAAMVTALDAEIGRLLAGLADRRDRTAVIFLGDNGSPDEMMPGKAKGTLFEPGVRVPLVVAAPGAVAGASVDALVNTTDVWATVAELAGIPLPLERPDGARVIDDSTSFAPYLTDPSLPSLRRYAWVEQFAPNGCADDCRSDKVALIGPRYKLFADGDGGNTHLVDLQSAAGEDADLSARIAANPELTAVSSRMKADLQAWLRWTSRDRLAD